MPLVKVIPVIGRSSIDRLGSMAGCHALHEKAVTKLFRTTGEVGEAITEALYEIALADAVGRKRSSIDEMSYLVEFIGVR